MTGNRQSFALFVFRKIGVTKMKALDLVGHIVTYSEQTKRPATNLRLQALLYRIQQEYLKRYGRIAFDDETKYTGEVAYYPDVYYEYAPYAWRWYIINVLCTLYLISPSGLHIITALPCINLSQ